VSALRTRTYRIETLGCKANVYDSRRLGEALEALGWRPADDGEPAAACILNTCTVTAVADRKCRQRAARLVKDNPGARVFLTGCYASASPSELARLSGLAGVYGREAWHALLQAVNGGPLPEGAAQLSGDFGIGSFQGRARAFLKVQEGCDSFCSYCILPYVRGEPRSRPLSEVGAEAERLASAGFAEIVITGIHVGLYGRDLRDRPSLASALLAVAETPGVARVRLSSTEPNEVTEDLVEAMTHPRICPHLHIPLQSGDAGVLKRMNRSYTPEDFLRVAEGARARLDRPAITTDVMVGFPGETDAQFERTLALCRAARFSRIHVFPFSPRRGTAAAKMPGRVPAKVMQERSRRLHALGKELAAEWAESFVGAAERVVFETCSAARRARRTPPRAVGRLTGYTDRYVRLTAPGDADLAGRAARVLCTARRGSSLLGRLSHSVE
jgi:threonylcarbamoyladenosine tRNA methylthiotransferase MtaB